MAEERQGGRPVAVFGSSETRAGEPLYEAARRLGGLLARAGCEVFTGGYGGVMEGASRGAREAGGVAVGVTCATFRRRLPNAYLSRVVHAPDLFDRTRRLIEDCRGFVILSGKAGTLAELAFLWAIHRAGRLNRRPLILLGDEWRHVVRHLVKAGILESPQFDVTRVVDTPEEAVDTLELFFDVSEES